MTAVGMSESTAQAQAMAALLDAARVALADELDGFGNPIAVGVGFRWPIVGTDWFFGTDTSGEIDPKVLGPRRMLDEKITLTVSVGTWQAFDPDAEIATEQATINRAFHLLGLVQDYIRTQDITLGDTVLWCLPSSSNSATGSDAANGIGRLTEITATFVCMHRIVTG